MVSNLQIHNDFERRYNRVTSNKGKKVGTEDIDAYFNEAQREWVKDRVSIAKTNSKVRYDLRKLEIIDKRLNIIDKTKESWIIAQLPEDYYDIQSYDIRAKVAGCDIPYKLDDVSVIQGNDWSSTMSDPNWAPSFLWRRTLVDENSQGLRVGKSNFIIDSVSIDYYRKPKPIYSVELSDCYKESKATLGFTNKVFELDDMQADEIIDIAVYFVSRDTGNFKEAMSQYEKVMRMYKDK